MIHRGVYRVVGEHLQIAVYDGASNTFIGIREKNGVRFLEDEAPAPSGTCAILSMLAIAPPQLELSCGKPEGEYWDPNEALLGYLGHVEASADAELERQLEALLPDVILDEPTEPKVRPELGKGSVKDWQRYFRGK